MFRPRARYFPWMESTQRSPGLRTRTQSARLEKGLNLFGAGVNLGPFRPPPAAARAGQIRRPLFSTLRLSCALPFRLRLLRSSHHVGPDALIGPQFRRPGSVTEEPPHPLVLASSASFISAETAETHSLRCSSSPQRDRWRWVMLGTPNGHLPPGWGRLVGCVLQASPLRGEAVERSETDEGADHRTPGG